MISAILASTLLYACETTQEVTPLSEATAVTPKAASAKPTHRGRVLFSKYGVNLNNKYQSTDRSKTDWLRYLTYEKELTPALNTLENKIAPFKIYRVGFSRNMVTDPIDLAEWIQSLKTIAAHGDKMIIAFWGQHEYNRPYKDGRLWNTVVSAIGQDPALLNAIKGWELSNEPTIRGKVSLGDYYKILWRSVANWHNKKIILDGGAYAMGVSKNLAASTTSIKNRIWAVHAYNNYINATMRKKYGTTTPSLTSKQWKNEYIAFFNTQYKHIAGNYIVTELGVSDNYPSSIKTEKDKKIRGFIAACETYFGQKTTVFWYSGYHNAKIGLVDTKNGAIRTRSKAALDRILFGITE